MKKKSKVLMVGAAVAAVTVFAATALAASPNTAGYEAFKDVLKANHQTGDVFESATVRGNFSVTLDGEKVLTADGTTKVKDAGGEPVVSSDFGFTLLGVERSGSLYSSGDDSVYLVDRTHDLRYQVINLDDAHGGKRHEWAGKDEARKNDKPMSRAEEAFLDFMVGDLKDNFQVTNHADGSKTITADIRKAEIPLPVRLVLDAASSDGIGKREHATESPESPAEWERIKQLPFLQGLADVNLDEQLPELTDDVAIERVRLELTVDADNALQGVHGELEVSGKDEAGAAHRVELEGTGAFGGINATTPDLYDPAGKTAEIFDAASFDDRN